MAEFNDDDQATTGGGDEDYIDPDEISTEIEDPEDAPKKKRIQPWMIIVGSMIVAGLIGIGMKSMKSGQEPGREVQPLPASVAMQPAQPIQPVSIDSAVQPIAPVHAEPLMDQMPSQSSATTPPAMAAEPKNEAPQPTNEDVANIKTQVSDIADRLSSLEKKVDHLSARKTVASVGVKTSRTKKPTAKHDAKEQKTEPKIADAKQDGKPESKGATEPSQSMAKYRIKAIPSTFQDQVWIEDAEGTVTVVNVGDSFAGAKILSIDADHFEVKTDKGVIR